MSYDYSVPLNIFMIIICALAAFMGIKYGIQRTVSEKNDIYFQKDNHSIDNMIFLLLSKNILWIRSYF